jgi:hypothetical protein
MVSLARCGAGWDNEFTTNMPGITVWEASATISVEALYQQS